MKTKTKAKAKAKKSGIIHPFCSHCGLRMAYGERFFNTHRHTFSKCVNPKCRFHEHEDWLGDIALNRSERKAYEKALKSGKLGKWSDMVHYPPKGEAKESTTQPLKRVGLAQPLD